MSKHSEACCKLPPVVASGYKIKGSYQTLDNGMKAYITGPAEATQAILIVYDIFGYLDQILQGADILAHSDKEHQYQVIMPDFFDGQPLDLSVFPPKTDAHKETLGKFFATTANPEATQKKIPECLKAAEKLNPNIKAWGALGYCWGGKMISLLSGPGTPLTAAAQTSPAMIDPKDAENISIPMCLLTSQDENVDDIKKFEENLKGVKHVETYETMPHGFMSAKADLSKDDVLKEYERGYKAVLTFFHENL